MKEDLHFLELAQAGRNALIKKIRASQEAGDLATLIRERNAARRELNEMRCARERSRREEASKEVRFITSVSGAWSSW